MSDDQRYSPGANWSSKDGKRNVVIVSDESGFRGLAFSIRNLASGRESRIEVSGLERKFRFVGFDPAFVHRCGLCNAPTTRETNGVHVCVQCAEPEGRR